MLPAAGYVGTSANPTATAASIAFPPRRRISTPASLASVLLLATIAFSANVARPPASNRHPSGKVTTRRARIAGAGSGGASVLGGGVTHDATAIAMSSGIRLMGQLSGRVDRREPSRRVDVSRDAVVPHFTFYSRR